MLRNQLMHDEWSETDKAVLLQAATSLETLAQTQPRDIAAVTYCIAGFIRLAQDQTPESIEAFRRARHLSPGENMNARITSLIEWRQLFARY